MTPRPRPLPRGKFEGPAGDRDAARGPGKPTGPRQRSASAPSERNRRIDEPRAVAYSVLRSVSGDDAYANLVLPGLLRGRRLTGRDAGFATELTYGTLRGQGYYDAVIAKCIDRDLSQVDPAVLDALRLGTHQLLSLRVGAHAAVDSTVALARNQIGIGASKFVNAVLRRVSEVEPELWPDRATEGLSASAARAVRASHPEWIIRAFSQALALHGRDAAEIDALLDADNVPATPALAALPGLSTVEELLSLGAEPGEWSPVAALAAGLEPAALEAVRTGRARVQDEGSQLVAAALLVPGAAGRDGATEHDGEEWLDLCAGPGGKSALLAAHALGRGASLTAVELSEHRAVLVEKALAPIDGRHRVICADGRSIGAEHPGAYDRVLVDAPCTGLGALRRRPEARWRRKPADIGALGPVQRELLASAVAATRPGGVIAYTTCSPHYAESIAVIEDILKADPGLELLDAPGALDAVAGRPVGAASKGIGNGACAQLWPHVHGTDGMFLALLRKRA